MVFCRLSRRYVTNLLDNEQRTALVIVEVRIAHRRAVNDHRLVEQVGVALVANLPIVSIDAGRVDVEREGSNSAGRGDAAEDTRVGAQVPYFVRVNIVEILADDGALVGRGGGLVAVFVAEDSA